MRVNISFKDAEITQALKRLKRRKAVFIECALKFFLKTENGKMLLEALAIKENQEPHKNNQNKTPNETSKPFIDKISIDDFLK